MWIHGISIQTVFLAWPTESGLSDRQYLDLLVQLQKDCTSCTSNYLPSNTKTQDYLSSCTSSGCILQLCKLLSVSVQQFRRSCAYNKYGQTGTAIPIHPPKTLLRGGYKKFMSNNNFCKILK